jgi:nitroreductase
MGRLGRPSDIGNAVALMCSEHASWITGQTIHVDGGASLMDTAFLIRQQIGQLLERSSRSRRTDLQDTTRVPALRRHPALSQIASGMTPEELLTTTRSVRRRLDLTRPVPRELILECIDIATQAPTGSNRQGWQWVIVTDAEKRKFIGERYREAWYAYAAGNRPTYEASDPRAARQERVRDSAMYLADHMGEVPALAIACHQGRVDGGTNLEIAGLYGSILPAVWSFMLAGRLRGLGTAYTTLHLKYEQEIAQLLSIPYAEMTQAAMLPVAY